MNDFDRNNERTGIYWLNQPVEDLRLKITLKPQSSSINLPKYEDIVSTTNTVDLERIEMDRVEEYVFKWQEKVFSRWEINHYKAIHNRINNANLVYNDMSNAEECGSQKIFTYINEDYRSPLPLNGKRSIGNDMDYLNLCLGKLRLFEGIGATHGDSSSMHRLFRSDECIAKEKEQWMAMHVVYDDSLYTEDSQLLVKQEYALMSIYYNTTHNYLLTAPDVNDVMLNPYDVILEPGASSFQYGVEITFDELESDGELVMALNKLYEKWEKRHKQLTNFEPPPPGKRIIIVAFEILSATGFDMDGIYIEYEIKLPDDMKCTSTLNGRTHVSRASQTDDALRWNYGHLIQLELEVPAGTDSPSLQLFFEAISTDWWGRHRTEGYHYLPLALKPGNFTERLSCTRPEERNKVEAVRRRFFVGGCHLIKDLEVLSMPQLQEADFTYRGTGNIEVRWSTVQQAHVPGVGCRPASPLPGSSSASALLKGAEAVLRQYGQARARLAAATKDLGDVDRQLFS